MKKLSVSLVFLVAIFGFVTVIQSCVKGIDAEAEEKRLLQQYLDVNNITVDPTASGLYYIEEEEGTGVAPEIGDTVSINYVTQNVVGKIYDTNIEEKAKEYNIWDMNRTYEPFRFEVGDSSIILGLNEGITYMKEGGIATIIMPSHLAYFDYMTLVFFVELLAVEKTDPSLSAF